MTTVIKRNNWEIWRDVIFALFAREIRTGFNDKLGISWSVIQPVAFVFILSFIRGRMDGGETHGLPTFVFMAYGMILIQSFLLTFENSSKAIRKCQALYAFRQVKPISAVIAAGLFELLVKVFVVLGIGFAMFLMQMEVIMADPLRVALYFISVWMLALSLGLAFGMIGMYFPEIRKLQSLFSRPLFFISGVFFSLQDVPKEYWWMLDWNPILHAIELSRFAAYSGYGNEGVSAGYLLFTVLTMLFMSLVFYQFTWKQGVGRQ